MKVKNRRPGGLFFDTIHLLVKAKNHFVFYQIVAIVLTILCVIPIYHFLLRMSIQYSGYSYITMENFSVFIRKPITIVSITIMFVIGGFFLIWNFSLMLLFLQFGVHNEKKAGAVLFIKSIFKALSCIRYKKVVSVLLVYAVLIANNVTVIYGILTRTRIPRDLVESISDIPTVKVLICCLVFVITIACIKNFFTLPYMILEGKDTKSSYSANHHLVRKRLIRTILLFLLWNCFVIILSVGVYMAILVLEAVFVNLFIEKNMATAVFLTIYEQYNIYTGIFLAWLGVYMNTGLLIVIFRKYRIEENEESSLLTEEEEIISADRKRYRMFILTFILCIIMVDGIYTYDSVQRGIGIIPDALGNMQITAHRGSSYEAPENTMAAIEKAIENMADYAEIDVQETKDGEVILLHDSNLLRTTGYNAFIWEVTLEKLRTLDAGSWMSEEYAGTQIPTLEEVLAYCKGKIKLNIEIKSNGKFNDLEGKVAALIEKYDFQRQCVVSSVAYRTLEKVKEANPEIRTGYIVTASFGEYTDKSAIDFFSMDSTYLNRNKVEEAHKNGKEVHAWTVNTKNEIRRMKVIKVDSIITDRPILAREIIYKEDFNKNIVNILKLVLKG
ncbi:glycerophosphodiester phosphodiesterase [Anaeromicropila populeti]|uniref:Glycerophosphoryl diester phosphodiesterase n=1 Tax=Anaeromicropila populeti TaxID=37658 RepID=A0A1I6KJX2_9FIRM|nr:glycerophosphodiester phosphodiesterase [Anaeromicropila populeti]SFR91529.1 glycerophosphoryl diester phosphodiesterase [Anaeromicropila populeti]